MNNAPKPEPPVTYRGIRIHIGQGYLQVNGLRFTALSEAIKYIDNHSKKN